MLEKNEPCRRAFTRPPGAFSLFLYLLLLRTLRKRLADYKPFLVPPGHKVRIKDLDPNQADSLEKKKEEIKEKTKKFVSQLDGLQEMLFAEHKRKLLLVLQGMDTSGKDGVIRRIFEGVNPAGVRVAHFREPSQEEIDRGFLWRAYREIPGSGEIVIFNRSHYEGVLVERVHKIVPTEVWQKRYEEINSFEKLLVDESTVILKFFLFIDSETQKKRIEERIKDPTKEWKFSESDLLERKFWDEYMKAYEDMLSKTSTEHSPWYVIPSNHRWFRDFAAVTIIVETLQSLKLSYPKLPKDLKPAKVP
jgi:PPK2 family polyphosphate:nucleotide phosphotransferase